MRFISSPSFALLILSLAFLHGASSWAELSVQNSTSAAEDATLFSEFDVIPAECKKLSVPGDSDSSFLKKINFGKRLQDKRKKYCHKRVMKGKMAKNAAKGAGKLVGGIVFSAIVMDRYQKAAEWAQNAGKVKDAKGDLVKDAAGKSLDKPKEWWHSWAPVFLPNVNNSYAGAAAGGLFAGLSGAFNGMFDFWEKGRMSLPEGLSIVHEEVKKESAEYVSHLPADFQAAIAAIDNRITQDLGSQQSDVALKKLTRREETLLSLPHQILNIAHYEKNGDTGCRKVIDDNITKLIQSYPSENYEVLKVLIQQIRDNSFLKNPNPAQAYLYGPPGTGKTTFVRRLGKALGLDVCEISVNNLESQGLLGVDHSDEWVSMDDFKVLGRVGDCFRKSKTKNPIIFFDEASHIMSNYQPGKGL